MQRPGLALEAAASGVMEALLAATAAHKSAAAVCAGASCLQMCLAAPELRDRLGQLPGKVPAGMLRAGVQAVRSRHVSPLKTFVIQLPFTPLLEAC